MFLLKPAPHKEAAKFISDKPAVARAVFDELLPELRARAFTVSGIEAANVLQDLRDRIADLPLGGDWDKIKADLVEKVSPFMGGEGDDPEAQAKAEGKARRRAELLLRLHGFQAYAASAYRVMDRQRDVFPFWMYRSMGDGKVRDSHAALNGKILPANSAFWQRHYPPWEWGCRCQVVPMMEMDVEEIRDAEKDRPLEERRVLEGAALEAVEQRGTLVSGPNRVFDLRTPIEKGKPGGFEWSPGELTLTPEQLQERYSPEVWEKFETWAREALISGTAASVWGWMNGEPLAKPPYETEIEITPNDTRTDLEDLRSDARGSREALARVQPGDDGIALPGGVARALGAEIAAVASGRKPVCHEQLGPLADLLVPRLSAVLGDRARVAARDGHLYVLGRGAPDIDTVHRLTLAGENGPLLGYGRARLGDPTAEIVTVRDARGLPLGGFHAAHDEAEHFARLRAADYADALGETVRASITHRRQ
jgi:SPP1 gp7 family putative phage head morphogenesis protein